MAPMGRGEEPQVRTTVASSARRPALRQSRKQRNKRTSRFSTDRPQRSSQTMATTANAAAVQAQAQAENRESLAALPGA
jgi:hypothetical protein